MRILLLTQWFDPEPALKGLVFARALRDRGHEVEVLTGFPNYPEGRVYEGYRVRPWQREEMDGVRVNRVALYPSYDRSGVRRIANYLSFAASAAALGPRLVRRPDVVYVYNLITLNAAARRLKRKYGCPVVYDVQDLWPESVADSGMLSNPALLRCLTGWSNRVYRAADAVAVLSPGFKRNLTERSVAKESIEVIYNWSDEASIHACPRDEALARELGMAGRFNVVFAGTMGVLQALDCVLEAAQSVAEVCPDIQFVFVGGGTEAPRLARKSADLGLRNVRFLPRVPRPEIGRILSLADGLLVHLKRNPLFEVTIPSKTQAYMSVGRPVLMGVRGDAARLVVDAGCGITFTPEDPGSLADAVMRLASMDADERRTMGQRGRDYYERELSMRVGVDRFVKLFTKVLNVAQGTGARPSGVTP